MKWKRKELVLGLASLVLSLSFFNITRGAGYQPSWVHVGVSATYDFGGGGPGDIPYILFNDSRAFGAGISGNCSWTAMAVGGGVATLNFEIHLLIPGSNTSAEYDESLRARLDPCVVQYTGKQFVELAETGDFSFVTTLPIDQIDPGEIYIVNDDPPGTYIVGFWGGFNIERAFNITVNLQDLTMIDEQGVPWGKWLFWINPLLYPVDESVHETALYDWNGIQVERNVTYVLPGKEPYWEVQTLLGNFSEYYLGTIWPLQIQNPEAVDPFESLFLMQTATYEPRIGMLLNTLSTDYVDDILAQKLGILDLNPKGHFWLSRLQGISFNPQEAAEQFDYAPYLVIVGVVTAVVLVFLGCRRRLRR